MTNKGHTTHGLSRREKGKPSLLHQIWTQMRQRCKNPRDKSYKDYGGRGISVCSEWEVFSTFHAWAMANGYCSGLSIERSNNDGNYEPDNCTWIPMGKQRRNNRRIIKITLNGETKILADWVKDSGIKYSTAYARIKKGIPFEVAIKKEALNDHATNK